MPGPAFGDPDLEGGGAAAELAKRFVQAVSGAVIAQVELVSGYVGPVLQRVRLDAVHLDHAVKMAIVEVIDCRAWQQLLDHDNGLSDLRGQLRGGSRVPQRAQLAGDGKRPGPELANRDVRAPLQHARMAVGPPDSRMPVCLNRALTVSSALSRSTRGNRSALPGDIGLGDVVFTDPDANRVDVGQRL